MYYLVVYLVVYIFMEEVKIDIPDSEPQQPLMTGCDILTLLSKFSFLDIQEWDDEEIQDIKREMYEIMIEETKQWNLVLDRLWDVLDVLAPNGKKSSLYSSLIDEWYNQETVLKTWLQVRTRRFKEWFGDWRIPTRESIELRNFPLVTWNFTTIKIAKERLNDIIQTLPEVPQDKNRLFFLCSKVNYLI